MPLWAVSHLKGRQDATAAASVPVPGGGEAGVSDHRSTRLLLAQAVPPTPPTPRWSGGLDVMKKRRKTMLLFLFSFLTVKRGHFLGRQNPLAESISVSTVN